MLFFPVRKIIHAYHKSKITVVYKVTGENVPLLVPKPRGSHDNLFALLSPSSFSVYVFLCVL